MEQKETFAQKAARKALERQEIESIDRLSARRASVLVDSSPPYQLVSARISCSIIFAYTIYEFGHSADTVPVRRYVSGNSRYRIEAPLAPAPIRFTVSFDTATAVHVGATFTITHQCACSDFGYRFRGSERL